MTKDELVVYVKEKAGKRLYGIIFPTKDTALYQIQGEPKVEVTLAH